MSATAPPPAPPAPERLPTSAVVRLVTALVVGVVVGGGATLLLGRTLGPLVGLVALHATTIVWGWAALWPLDANATRTNARREDFDPVVVEIVGVVISIGALLAIGTILLVGSSRDEQAVTAALALLGVVVSWGSLHLVYTGHYAFLYYDARRGPGARPYAGGIDWNDPDHDATYRDFLYFSYNLGMTYQVSDTSVSSPAVRAVTLRHCLLSYLFGAAILGATINIVSGIATSGS